MRDDSRHPTLLTRRQRADHIPFYVPLEMAFASSFPSMPRCRDRCVATGAAECPVEGIFIQRACFRYPMFALAVDKFANPPHSEIVTPDGVTIEASRMAG